MEEKKNIFDYIRQLFAIYGVMVLIFVLFNLIVGDEAKSISTLFTLGSQGLLSSTLLQLLLMAAIITAAQNIFLTDILIKDLALIIRNILFFVIILIAITAFVIIFGWFPIDNAAAWIGFIISSPYIRPFLNPEIYHFDLKICIINLVVYCCLPYAGFIREQGLINNGIA